jgi:tetratricopeptide (TPR) repeat protein
LILLGVSAIALAATLSYWPALHGGFVLDDDLLLTESKLIKAPDGLFRIWFTAEPVDYWPVTNSSLWIEWRLWGLDPTGYHVTNLILHISAALLIWLVLRRLSIHGAFLAALLFAVHPVNVESVAWISQRKGLLAIVFFLLSIYFYLRAQQPQDPIEKESTSWKAPLTAGRWYWLSLLFFLLAMLSKGSVAILPLVLLLIAWWQRRQLKIQDLLRTLPFWVVATVLTGVNLWFQARSSAESFRTVGFAVRLEGAGAVVWFYLSKALLPIHLAFIYPHWQIHAGNWIWWLPVGAAAAVTAILFWRRNTWWGRPLLFAWIFFCVALVPVMGFTDVGFMKYSLVADHYQHIAIIAVVALAAAAWSYWNSHANGRLQRTTIFIAFALVSALAILTFQQSRLYRNGASLYAASLEQNPSSWLLHFNLGNALDDVHRPEDAVEQYRQAIAINPDYLEAHYNLGNVLAHLGHADEARQQYQKVLQLKPEWAPRVHNALGVLMDNAGHPQEAADEYRQAVDLMPDQAEFHFNLGNALLALGRTQESTEQYQQALKLRPDLTEARDKLRSLATGGTLSALDRYQQALQQNPNSAELHYNLGNALVRAGRAREAFDHYQTAFRLKPNFVEAYNGLGAALLMTARPQEATKYLEKALQVKPDYVQAAANLANAYSQTNRPDEALAVAQKALEMARSQGQTAVAQQMEAWLASYRAKLSSGAGQSNAPGQTSALDQSAAPDATGRQPIAPPPTSPGSNSGHPAP